MKVILLKDVPKIGKKYDEKKVSDGYAMNFLIPNGLVEVATEKAMERANMARTEMLVHRKIQEDLVMKNLVALSEAKIEFKEKANEKGHLFAGIHKEALVKALKEQARIDVPVDFIELLAPLKEVGEKMIRVKVQDKVGEFKVTISAI